MRTSRHRPMADINVVPYIDVMLVLLIIFMITAPSITTQVPVNLPDANADPIKIKQDKVPLIVSVTAKGDYLVERDDKALESMSLQEVTQYVRRVLQQASATPVFVQGDETVAYGKVIELMSALQQAGAEQVGLVTESADQP
jgi:biopolymer transport protein TolR